MDTHEEDLKEQLRAQAEEAEKKETAERNRAKNLTRPTEETFERDARKDIPKIYRDMEDKSRAVEEENKQLKRQIENITESFLQKNNGAHIDTSKFDGGPVADIHSNRGGAISSEYVK